MKMNFKKLVAAGLACVTLVATMSMNVFAADESYTATLGFADGSWGVQDWASNVTITGDGTYTINAATPEAAASGITVFVVDIAGLLTNEDGTFMSINDTDYTISDVKVTVDGTEVSVNQDNVVYGDTEEKGNLRIELCNTYGPTTDASFDGGDYKGAGGGAAAVDATSFAYSTSMSVTFTIAGLDEVVESGDSTNVGIFAVAAVAALGVCAVAGKKRITE